MAFIRDSLNTKVFLLVVLVVVAMVSLVVVFRKNFEEINSRYSEKVEELNSTFENLIDVQANLNKTAEELDIRSLREEDLKDKYGVLKDEKDALITEKIKLLDEVEDKTQEIKVLNIHLAELNEDVGGLRSQVADLSEKIDCLLSTPDPNEAGC